MLRWKRLRGAGMRARGDRGNVLSTVALDARILRIVGAALIALLLGCTLRLGGTGGKPNFTPTGTERFGPSTSEILVLDSPPVEPYLVIGYAEARGENMGDAIPKLKKLAQENGGNALLSIEATTVNLGVISYRAKVIRYGPAAP